MVAERRFLERVLERLPTGGIGGLGCSTAEAMAAKQMTKRRDTKRRIFMAGVGPV